MSIKPSRVCPTRPIEEPNLQDLLADPTTHLVMQSDGVSRKQLADVLAAARLRLQGLSRRKTRGVHVRPPAAPRWLIVS